MNKTAKELGFKPQYVPMTESQTKMLMKVLCTKEESINILEKEIPFPIQILDKRIKVMKLPIKFSITGKLAALILSNGNPGRMITILIDALTQCEENVITAEEICNIYPVGFYTEDSFIEYVENYLKPKKVKWSNIY